jgi:membrane associated rhomboid family serine protease
MIKESTAWELIAVGWFILAIASLFGVFAWDYNLVGSIMGIVFGCAYMYKSWSVRKYEL